MNLPRLVERVRSWAACRSLWLALGIGLALRLIGLRSREIQYDDAFSMLLSARSLPEIVSGTAADTMPPLYYFLLHFWMLVSREIWFVRLLSVLISLATIVLLFLTVERWLGKTAAGWAALLAAISPLQIYHGQDVRMYALLVLGQAGYAWFFTRIWFVTPGEKRSWLNWLGLVAFGLIAIYSHNLAVFALVVPDVFLLVRRRWKLLARLLAAQLVIGLGALPWLVFIPGQMEKIQRAFWTPRPGMVEIIQAVIMFHAAMPLPSILLAIAAISSFQVLVMVALEVTAAWRKMRDGSTGFLVMLLVLPPVLLFLVSYLMRPVFVPRGFLVASLAYAGLGGFAIARSWARGPGKLITAGFLLAALVSLPSYYTFQSFPRSPFRAAAADLARQATPGSVVIHETKLSYFPMHVYQPELRQEFLADEPGSINDTFAPGSQRAMQIFPQSRIEKAAAGSGKVYFVTFRQVFEEYQAMGAASSPVFTWLSSHYHLAGQQVFHDLEVYTFER